MVQAGDAPRIGGTKRRPELATYRAVYAALRAALELKLDWNSGFQLAGKTAAEKKEKTERRHTRFAAG